MAASVRVAHKLSNYCVGLDEMRGLNRWMSIWCSLRWSLVRLPS
jgi:hypothetical protein